MGADVLHRLLEHVAQTSCCWCLCHYRHHHRRHHRRHRLTSPIDSYSHVGTGQKGPRSFQDERYSYVVLRRGPRPVLGHHTLLTPNPVVPVETERRMRNVVVGGVDEDNLSLSNVVASYEAPALSSGDWDAGMAGQLSLEGTAWLDEAAAALHQQDAAFSAALLEEFKRTMMVCLVGVDTVQCAFAHFQDQEGGSVQDAAEEDAEEEGDAMDPAVEALIRDSILSDDEEPASGQLVQASGLTDPAVVAQWQEERKAEALAMREAQGEMEGPGPEMQLTDLTDPRPGAARIQTSLDNTEEEITLKEVFPAAFAATLEDAGQWSRIVRYGCVVHAEMGA